jgi:hypothetical protein
MSTEVFILKRGDTLPAIESTLYNRVGGVETVVDLGGASDVFFRIYRKSTGELISRNEATIVAPTNAGLVRYDWNTQDTAEAGQFVADWEVSFVGGVRSFPTVGRIPITVLD